MYQAKRSRDQQLNETRKDVERRKESVDKAHEKRVYEIFENIRIYHEFVNRIDNSVPRSLLGITRLCERDRFDHPTH